MGNTTVAYSFAEATTVHPHACGEHHGTRFPPCLQAGSSPRMWGTPSSSHRRLPLSRFIPTHVGNTLTRIVPVEHRAVHPHACGEHYLYVSKITVHPGSSPRMWGTLLYNGRREVVHRFIPTHVGNTMRIANNSIPRAVHPHACGEHFDVPGLLGNSNGSSPRMWGTHRRWARRAFLHRFIPTHVGNTYYCRSKGRHGSVHPHACGEHIFSHHHVTALTGSSPRMWGTQFHFHG